MTKPYVYEIEHIETGKKYIGSRTKKGCDSSELLILGENDCPRGYLTSSNIVNDIIKKEGNAAFKINFIIECSSKKDALEKETALLLEVDARNNSEYYNMHNNDGIYKIQKLCEEYNVDHISQIPEIAKKVRNGIRKFHQENPDFFKGENNPMYGKNHLKETKELIRELKSGENHPFYGVTRPEHSERMKGENNPMYGKNHSKETIKKQSESKKGKYVGENNPMYGKTHSAESKLKNSESNKNRERVICPHCEKISDISNAKRWHFDNCKHKKEVINVA